MSEFSNLQGRHPDVVFDLSKETRSIKLRGREEFVNPAKEDLMNVDVKLETLVISAREASLIVGKGGKTINRLVDEHNVGIQVENQKDAR